MLSVSAVARAAKAEDPAAIDFSLEYRAAEGCPDASSFESALQARLPDAQVLSHQSFRKRSLDYWLFETGAGSGLIAGAVLGMVPGLAASFLVFFLVAA